MTTPAAAQSYLYERPPAAGGFPFFGPWGPQQQVAPAPPADYSRAPAAKKPETPPTTTVIVMGDAMADWLAYGLEDAFSDSPEMGIVRKHRTLSGLIRYDSRTDQDWARVAREILAPEKPSAIVMMVGLNDRQAIREKPAAKGAQPPPPPPPAPGQEQQQQPDPESPDLQIMAPEGQRSPSGSSEFRSERWNELYIRRIDETIAALKSKGVPVIWVGLPIIRGPKATADVSYLNDLYRAQAEKAGIIYVDVWEGFVDEGGKFTYQGPDVEGQTRRLRTADGVYFTKAGARKLAHFVEREISRVMSIKTIPVALPTDEMRQPSGAPRPGGPAPRPVAGAIVPLTATPISTSEELLGGGRAQASAPDPSATRVLVKGEPVAPLQGRADDFAWGAREAATAAASSDTAPPAQPPAPVAAPAAAPAAPPPPKNAAAPGKQASQPEKPLEGERSQAQTPRRQPPPFTRDNAPRPPAPLGPSTSPFGWFR